MVLGLTFDLSRGISWWPPRRFHSDYRTRSLVVPRPKRGQERERHSLLCAAALRKSNRFRFYCCGSKPPRAATVDPPEQKAGTQRGRERHLFHDVRPSWTTGPPLRRKTRYLTSHRFRVNPERFLLSGSQHTSVLYLISGRWGLERERRICERGVSG